MSCITIAAITGALLASAGVAKAKDGIPVTLQVVGTESSQGDSQTYANFNRYYSTINTVQLERAHVRAIMPNGDHVVLGCQSGGFHRCSKLNPGSYNGEIKGNSIYIQCFSFDGKSKRTIKYNLEGSW